MTEGKVSHAEAMIAATIIEGLLASNARGSEPEFWVQMQKLIDHSVTAVENYYQQCEEERKREKSENKSR